MLQETTSDEEIISARARILDRVHRRMFWCNATDALLFVRLYDSAMLDLQALRQQVARTVGSLTPSVPRSSQVTFVPGQGKTADEINQKFMDNAPEHERIARERQQMPDREKPDILRGPIGNDDPIDDVSDVFDPIPDDATEQIERIGIDFGFERKHVDAELRNSEYIKGEPDLDKAPIDLTVEETERHIYAEDSHHTSEDT